MLGRLLLPAIRHGDCSTGWRELNEFRFDTANLA